MDEGVDPTKMCQTLVNRVASSRQLQAVSNPAIIGLFEDWLDELEDEVIRSVQGGATTPDQLAPHLSLSLAGAEFLLTKLKGEKKIPETDQ